MEIKDFLKEVYSRFGEDRIALSAGAIAFFTLLSLVPFLLLAVTFVAPLLNELLDIQRPSIGPFYDLLKQQINYLAQPQTRIISIPFAIFFGLWGGSSIFLILESAINLAWHSQRKRPFWLRRALAFMMVLIVGVLMIGAALLTNLVVFLTSLNITLWGNRTENLSQLTWVILTFVLPTFLSSSLFAVIYKILPTKQVTFRAVIPGALFSGVLWVIALHLLGFYWYSFGAAQRYNVVYGSLTGIFLLMILLYYGALIFLYGAEISVVYHLRLVEAGNRAEQMVEETEILETRERAEGVNHHLGEN